MKFICDKVNEVRKKGYDLPEEIIKKQTYHLFLSYLYASNHTLFQERRVSWNMR